MYSPLQGFGEGVKLDDLSSPEKPELPPGWNSSQDVYALQYRHQATRQMCLVKAITMGETLLINVVVSNGKCWRSCVSTLVLYQGGHSDGQSCFYVSDAIKICQREPFIYIFEVSVDPPMCI